MAEAIKLSIAGYSLRAIGAKVGVSHVTVKEALDKEYADRRPPDEEVKLARALKAERLAAQLAAWAPRSIKGDPAAALAVARFERLLADLEGTDAPKAPENVLNVSAVATTTTEIETGPEATARLVRELFDKRAAKPPDANASQPDEVSPAHAVGAGEVPAGTPKK